VVALVVKNSHRKMGIGSLLMKAAENWAKEMNANSLILNSGNRPERIAAHQFYNKLGFQNYSSGFRKVL
jgi:GNAT superfamily N-acetyltransferase